MEISKIVKHGIVCFYVTKGDSNLILAVGDIGRESEIKKLAEGRLKEHLESENDR